MSWSGLQNTFTKGESRDIIDVSFPWSDIQNKPALLDKVIANIAALAHAAIAAPYLQKADTIRKVNSVINDYLLSPLVSDVPDVTTAIDTEHVHYIPITRDWDTDVTEKPENLDAFLDTLGTLFESTRGASFLSKQDTLRTVKNAINHYLLQPLKGGEIDSDLEN